MPASADSLRDRLRGRLPGLDPASIEGPLSALGQRYLERFSEEEIALQLEALAGLGRERPFATLLDGDPEGELSCTVLAFDYPSEFCFIAGVLSSMGFEVAEGEVFSFQSPGGPKIIDWFSGRIRPEGRSDEWGQVLASRLGRVLSILDQGGQDSLRKTRREVAELAASAMRVFGAPESAVLYPLRLELDDSDPGFTRMRVASRDTPYFLFAFGAALSLQGLSIVHAAIRTRGATIEDEFDFVDAAGGKITDRARLDRIKLSVLLAKQFTSFLGRSSDPRTALLRFEDLLAKALELPDRERWFELLSSQSVMGDLAALLGASEFLWEDFIRLQYETLIPMLSPREGGRAICESLELLPGRLAAALEGAESDEAFIQALNDFKDREIFLFDLDHILGSGPGFLRLSERLTALAELVVETAASRAYESLVKRHGEPRASGGLPARHAVLGLGKLGGGALGYASDIELLLVYSDSGSTAGPHVLDNAEFFGELIRSIKAIVRAKREGIFQVDLRLRPYGDSGPLACSLESFCGYYAPGGPAHSYERLALVRLRRLCGDAALGERIERLRDEFLYSGGGFDMAEFRALRERQLRHKAEGSGPNAKFGPGALVDLEYSVQILQVLHGAADPSLRGPRIQEALEALAAAGALDPGDAAQLTAAYGFFRRLINGLRMFRGSALDLALPEPDSEEYLQLARRMGYPEEGGQDASRALHLEYETRTAAVRAFAERRFGEGGFLPPRALNAADLVLSDSSSEEDRARVLRARGFANPSRAYVNLRKLLRAEEGASAAAPPPAEGAPSAGNFARLVVLACDILSRKPDPDMALNNWERYVDALPDAGAHFAEMLSQPGRLEILLDLFSTSQFLADSLIRRPELLGYLDEPGVLRARREASGIARELAELSRSSRGEEAWRDALRGFRRKELLRIGARDICLGASTRVVMEELSTLAERMIDAALIRIRWTMSEEARPASAGGFRLCILAFGKLGGGELNYSSDIDLVGIWDSSETAGAGTLAGAEAAAIACMERLRADLSDHSAEGYAYRVDLRLRPYGSAGQLIYQKQALLDYYYGAAAPWEIQALLKARPIAGDIDLGREFLEAAAPLIRAPRRAETVAASIELLRREALKRIQLEAGGATDVKSGLGGIREVEFLVQGLQLIHGHARPELLKANTLAGLEALGEARLLPAETAGRLAEDYLFLRKVEHFLQIYEDRQTHRLPTDPEELGALSRRMLGWTATEESFRSELGLRFERIHGAFEAFLGGAFREARSG